LSRRNRARAGRSYPWSDMDPDRRNAVLLVGGIGVVVLFSLALIAYGYYNDKIAPNHEKVLHVGKHSYDYSFLKRRVKAGLSESKIDISKEDAIPSVLTDIEREAILREAAKRDGVAATEAELRAQIATNLQMTAEATRNQIAPALRARLLKNGLSLSEYEDIARAQVAETKIKAQIESSIPVQAEQVAVRLIATSAQSAAILAKQRIEAGESFAVVAASVSQDPSKATAGDLGLVPHGALPADVDKVAFSITGLSDVIETKDAFYVIEVLGKEVSIVGGEARERLLSTGYTTKLSETRDAIGSHPSLNTGQVRRILGGLSASRA
jgi:hypothetical protein